MAIKTELESIKDKGGDELIKEDKNTIRKALSTTEFVYDGVLWVTEDGMSILDWLTYEVDIILSASLLASFVELLLQLRVDGSNDQRVRKLSNDELTDVAFDLRYAKGTGDISMYYRMLVKNGFVVFDPSVQIERICHTVRTEIEFRME